MKLICATSLAIGLAILLGSTGVSSALPRCPSDQNQYYGNCFGTYTSANGNKYVGEWKDDKFHGQGTETWPDGTKYVGEFRDGKPNGQGTYTYPDGAKYVGEYRDGKPNGQGTYTFANGKIKEGIWSNNVFQHAQIDPRVAEARRVAEANRAAEARRASVAASRAANARRAAGANRAAKARRVTEAAEASKASYSQKCQEMGFTPKTKNFGNCILRLMEMQSNNRALLEEQRRQRELDSALLEEQQRQRKLNRSLEIMRWGYRMMNPPEPKPKLSCTHNPLTYKTVCY